MFLRELEEKLMNEERKRAVEVINREIEKISRENEFDEEELEILLENLRNLKEAVESKKDTFKVRTLAEVDATRSILGVLVRVLDNAGLIIVDSSSRSWHIMPIADLLRAWERIEEDDVF